MSQNKLPTSDATDDKFATLIEYHGCRNMTQVTEDEQGDNACMAHMDSGRAFPCHCTSVDRLKNAWITMGD